MIVITGPTASGKTGKAVALAQAIGGEIISADSRQLYRGMDLGTGKDLDEYGDVPYHMIDICDAGYKYNLYEYLRDYQTCYDDITNRGKPVVLCGGTGMYVESVVKGIALPPVPENKEVTSTRASAPSEPLRLRSTTTTIHTSRRKLSHIRSPMQLSLASISTATLAVIALPSDLKPVLMLAWSTRCDASLRVG